MFEDTLRELAHEDAAIRYEAARKLGDAPDTCDARGIEALICALPDANHKVQYAAFSALVKLGAAQAAAPIIDMLLTNPGSQVWSLMKLNIGTRLRAGLLDMVAPGDSDLAARILNGLGEAPLDDVQRAYMLRLLGKTAHAPVFEFILETFTTGDEAMRIATAEALGWMGDSRAVEALLAALADTMTQDTVRETAAEALGRIGDERAIQPLITALTDREEWVRRAAAVALGQMGATDAMNALGDALTDDSVLVQDAAFASIQRLSNQRYTTVL